MKASLPAHTPTSPHPYLYVALVADGIARVDIESPRNGELLDQVLAAAIRHFGRKRVMAALEALK